MRRSITNDQASPMVLLVVETSILNLHRLCTLEKVPSRTDRTSLKHCSVTLTTWFMSSSVQHFNGRTELMDKVLGRDYQAKDSTSTTRVQLEVSNIIIGSACQQVLCRANQTSSTPSSNLLVAGPSIWKSTSSHNPDKCYNALTLHFQHLCCRVIFGGQAILLA